MKGRSSCRSETPIGPDDTLASVYFERLFPLGISALLEAADLAAAGRAAGTPQDESQASYEGWCRGAEGQINWHHHVDFVYNLIRGCNPAPGAWTRWQGKKLQIFDARKHLNRRFADVAGAVGTVTTVGEESISIMAQGGQIEVLKLRYEDGKKIGAAQFASESGLGAGAALGA